MSATVFRLILSYLFYPSIACAFTLVLLLTFFNWIAQNREISAFGEDIPPDGYFLPTKDGQVFLIDQGDQFGTQVLFAHGTAAWSRLWRPTLKAIAAKNFRATAFDMPPFGWSKHPTDNDFSRHRQAKRVMALLEAFDTKPKIVANSLGGGSNSRGYIHAS